MGIESWLNAINNYVRGTREPKSTAFNLLITQIIRNLKKLDSVMKHADKDLGLVPVLWHCNRNMCIEHISDRKVYVTCPRFLVKQIVKRMINIVRGERGSSYKVYEQLQNAEEYPQPSPFYVMSTDQKKKLFASRPVQAQNS